MERLLCSEEANQTGSPAAPGQRDAVTQTSFSQGLPAPRQETSPEGGGDPLCCHGRGTCWRSAWPWSELWETCGGRPGRRVAGASRAGSQPCHSTAHTQPEHFKGRNPSEGAGLRPGLRPGLSQALAQWVPGTCHPRPRLIQQRLSLLCPYHPRKRGTAALSFPELNPSPPRA